jgi:hypothetical protein
MSLKPMSNVAEIWEEAERRLETDKPRFAPVLNSRYLPHEGSLPEQRQLFEVRWQGRGGAKKMEHIERTDRLDAQTTVGSGSRLAKSLLKKVQRAMVAIKGGFSGPKHKRNEEKAVKLSIDIQCEDRRIQVKYSKELQKMKKRIMQEFHLKWKRWALFVRDEETSEWVKLHLHMGPWPRGYLTGL